MVGAKQKPSASGSTRPAGRPRRAAVEALLHVRRRRDPARARERFRLRPEIAVRIAGVGRFRALLLLGRQGEEGFRFRPGRLDGRVGHAVAGDGEKSGRPADRVDLGAKRPLLAGRASLKASQIEDRERRVGGHAETLSPPVRSGNEAATVHPAHAPSGAASVSAQKPKDRCTASSGPTRTPSSSSMRTFVLEPPGAEKPPILPPAARTR